MENWKVLLELQKNPFQKMFHNILSKYYQGDITKANELNSFILENREEVSKEILTRKIDKKLNQS